MSKKECKLYEMNDIIVTNCLFTFYWDRLSDFRDKQLPEMMSFPIFVLSFRHWLRLRPRSNYYNEIPIYIGNKYLGILITVLFLDIIFQDGQKV